MSLLGQKAKIASSLQRYIDIGRRHCDVTINVVHTSLERYKKDVVVRYI